MATNPSLSGNQPTILDDDNWPIWSIRTEGLLIEAGLWSVVADGVTPLPTAPAANVTQQEQAAYNAELARSRAETALDRKAKAFIQRHVSNLHIFTVKNANSAQDSWETLESQFTQSSVARQSQLQQQLSLLRMEPGESVSRFYARLQQLLTELEACSCETSESTVVLAILAALPPEYEGTVERLRYDQTSADLTVERIKRVLLQKEADLLSKQMQQQLSTSSSTLWSFSSPSEHRGAGSSGGQGGRGRSRAPQQPREQLSRAQSPDRSTRDASSHAHLTCNYCAKPGHIMSECFIFDRDQRNRMKTLFSNPARTSSPGRRPSPGRSSSPARPSSPGRGRTQTPGRAATQSPSRGASLFTATAAADDDEDDDDDDALMQMMQPRLNFNSDLYSPFFIDSGASQHILKDLQFFYNYTPFAPDKHRPVKLAAAGHRVWAVGSGSVFLSTKRGSWFLSHALYVPDSKENFISVSAATEDGSSFLFRGDLCQISSNRFGSMLRVNAHKIRNSYILAAVPMPDGPDTDSEPEKLYGIQQSILLPDNRVKLELLTNTAAPSANSSTSNSPKVWHQRLCHASYAALSRMQSEGMVSGVHVTASQFRAAASDPTVCVGCVKGKQHKNVAFADPPPNAAPVTAPLGLIHMDVCGPMHARARDGSLYVATFLDEHTKLSVCVPISSKSQVPDVVRTVIEQLETQSGFRCKAIRTDNGTEYVNNRMKEYCSSKGIVHQHSAPYSPQQNGAAERLNRTIFEKARSILHAANISLSFWAHAVKYANYIRCLLPVSGQPLTPWEAFYGVKPDLSGLRVFGCRVWLHVPDHKRSKLQSKSVEGLFLGYQPGSKAYLVEVNGRETCSKDIVFDELSVLQPTRQHEQPVQPVFLLPLPPSPLSSSEPAPPAEGGNSLQQTSSSGSDDSGSSSSDSSNRPGSSAQQPQSRPLQRIEAQEDSSRPDSPLSEPEQISLTARYEPGSHMWQQQQLELISRLPRPGIGRFSLRPMPLARETVGAQPVAPATAPEAERPAASAAVPTAARPAATPGAAPAAVRPSASAAAPTAARPAAAAARPGAPGLAQPARRVPLIPASAAAGSAAPAVHPSAPMPAAPEPSPEASAAPLARRNPPRERRLPLKLRQSDLCAMTVSDSPVNDTPTVAEALASPQADMWIEAMNAELASLHSNQTWSLEERPANARVLPTKWVLKVKRDAAGNVERYKARLVAKGYFQQSGVDVGDVYAPVSKHTTLRALLAKAEAENMEVHQLDFETAFLNGVLEEHEVIYVQQPEGFREGSSNTVCRLHKALYGLRQAPRAWHARLCEELLAMNFKSSEADPALFTLHLPSGTVYLLVYVDDCLLCTQQGDTTGLAYVKQKLSSVFKLKDLGEARCFLGMQIVRDRAEGTILISQQKLIHELVTTHSMSNAHSKTLPMAAAVKLVREGEALDTSVHHYSALVGSLLYLSCCTRPDIAFSVGALARHMSAPTKQHWAAACTVLCYLKGTSEQGLLFGGVTGLQGFTDADYAGDKDTARSTTGYLFTLNGGAISWSSRQQPTVAMSTAEAEYMAASSATKEALWLRKLMRDLQLEARCVQMSCDNQAALQLLHNPMATARAKHIDVHHHFVRERITRGEVAFSYCHTDSMLADIFTKPLAAVKFNAGKQGTGAQETAPGADAAASAMCGLTTEVKDAMHTLTQLLDEHIKRKSTRTRLLHMFFNGKPVMRRRAALKLANPTITKWLMHKTTQAKQLVRAYVQAVELDIAANQDNSMEDMPDAAQQPPPAPASAAPAATSAAPQAPPAPPASAAQQPAAAAAATRLTQLRPAAVVVPPNTTTHDRINHLEQENRSLKQRVRTLQAASALLQFNAQVDALQQQLIAVQARLADKEAACLKLQQQANNYKAKALPLIAKENLAKVTVSISRLEAERAAAQASAAQLLQAGSSLSEVSAALDRINTDLSKQRQAKLHYEKSPDFDAATQYVFIEHLQRQVADERQQRERAQNDLAQLRADDKAASQRLQQLRRQISVHKATIASDKTGLLAIVTNNYDHLRVTERITPDRVHDPAFQERVAMCLVDEQLLGPVPRNTPPGQAAQQHEDMAIDPDDMSGPDPVQEAAPGVGSADVAQQAGTSRPRPPKPTFEPLPPPGSIMPEEYRVVPEERERYFTTHFAPQLHAMRKDYDLSITRFNADEAWNYKAMGFGADYSQWQSLMCRYATKASDPPQSKEQSHKPHTVKTGLPAKFSGASGQFAEDAMFLFLDYLTGNNIPQPDWPSHILPLLEGKALQAWLSVAQPLRLSGGTPTWELMRDTLTKAFPCGDRAMQARKLLHTIKQQTRTPEYLRYFRMLVARAGEPTPTDRDLLLWYMRGLKSSIADQCKVNPAT
ncbi:hypothetical protein QJQ45_001625 [Haematococcus lacustris]|nr:hypothetical protein QJQ45_001625 [Haematococcus lacustris]